MENLQPNQPNVCCYGSAIIRVKPDIARINLHVDALENQPDDAFLSVQKKSAMVLEILNKMGVTQIHASKVSLCKETRWERDAYLDLGYRSKITINLLVREIDQVEQLILNCLNAGANHIDSVQFDTVHLAKLRSQARKKALQSARAKANDYCDEAGVQLGQVIKIDDLDPSRVGGNRESTVENLVEEDQSVQAGAIDPGAVLVAAAVQVWFKIL